jgi:hypothetical protein
MSYTLYNKTNGRTLDLKGATWTCDTLEEAKETLAACLECANTYPDLDQDNFVIVDVDSGEQVWPMSDF